MCMRYVACHKSTLSCTSVSPAVSYSRCTELLKLDELRHIKLARHKPGFSKCNTCYELKQKYRKAANKEEKREITRDHEEYIALNRGERIDATTMCKTWHVLNQKSICQLYNRSHGPKQDKRSLFPQPPQKSGRPAGHQDCSCRGGCPRVCKFCVLLHKPSPARFKSEHRSNQENSLTCSSNTVMKTSISISAAWQGFSRKLGQFCLLQDWYGPSWTASGIKLLSQGQ